MATLDYNEITNRKIVIIDDEPFEVLSSHVFRMQKRKPVNQTKLRSLISGRMMERSFHAAEKVDEADITTRTVKFLYMNRGEFWFCELNDPSKRFSLSGDVVGESGNYLKANTEVDLKIFTLDEEDKIIGVKVPIKMELLVKEAPPSIKGDTAQGGNKVVTLETGATVNVPLFINQGDIIRINTETGEYVERVTKGS